MTLDSAKKAMQLIADYPEQSHFFGPQSEALINAAEEMIGGKFPPSYRLFVKFLGAGRFGSSEIYGITGRNFLNSGVPNGIWLTMSERREGYLPDSLLIVASVGDGSFYTLALADGEKETPIEIFEPGMTPLMGPREKISADFGDFLIQEIIDQLDHQRMS